MGIKGFFKKIGGGLKGIGKKIGNTKPTDLGKIPILGGVLESAANAGTKLGEGIREKNIGKTFGGLKDSAISIARGAALPADFLAEEAMRKK